VIKRNSNTERTNQKINRNPASKERKKERKEKDATGNVEVRVCGGFYPNKTKTENGKRKTKQGPSV